MTLLSRLQDAPVGTTPPTDYAALLACYRSGQVSERQWTEHLKDAEFAARVEGQGRVGLFGTPTVCGGSNAVEKPGRFFGQQWGDPNTYEFDHEIQEWNIYLDIRPPRTDVPAGMIDALQSVLSGGDNVRSEDGRWTIRNRSNGDVVVRIKKATTPADPTPQS